MGSIILQICVKPNRCPCLPDPESEGRDAREQGDVFTVYTCIMRAVEAESGSSRNRGKEDPAEGWHLSWGLGNMGVQVKREGTLRKTSCQTTKISMKYR